MLITVLDGSHFKQCFLEARLEGCELYFFGGIA